MFRLSVRHNFETAHRFSHPESAQKCRAIHGHSWWAEVWVEGEDVVDDRGMLVEFGVFKKAWRELIDGRLDHHLLLNESDPVLGPIVETIGATRITTFPFEPTTENIARWLHEQAVEILASMDAGDFRIARVRVDETGVNAIEYEPPR